MATPEEIINNSQVGETFSDVGEIPGITTQSLFAPQTDPGEIPGITTQSVFDAQTDPGESPDTATDRLANVDENQSAAETARLNRQAVEAKTPEVPQIDVVNPLHKYDSYTYSLSLYMMDFTKDYESMVDSPNQFQAPADRCLIASAGRGKRAAGFNTEFYFEDLEFTTVLGITPQNRNSNLISGSFKIIEPLGFTFINRLVAATKDVVNPSTSPRYEQQPYLLKIEFFGIEEGKMKPTPVEGDGPSGKFTTTKHIPIRIINMTVEVTEKGSEYKVEFVPFHHQALMTHSVSIQTKFQLSGATIEEIFGVGPGLENKPFSITGAINKYYSDLAKKTNASAVANKIKFEIDPTIAKAKIYQLQKGSSSNPQINYKVDGGSWWVEPNQKLDRLIDFFIRNSSFFTSQIGESDRADESLKIYKILPKVKQIGFDEKANSNVFETTYVITPFAVTSKQPSAIKPKVEGQVKKYSYIFTGKNVDILDFKIDFKMLYLQTYSAFEKRNASMQGDPSLSKPELEKLKSETINEQPARKAPNDPTFSSQHHAVGPAGGQSGIAGPQSEKSEIANHVALDLLNTHMGDLVNLDLQIIGDPLFIKQDDLFYPPSVEGTQDLLTQNGSFIMDRGELYVMIEFNSPQDYNEDTGLTDIQNDYGYSSFSGIYKIISIKNSFSSGKFEQTLSMARIQQTPEIVKKAREQEKILDKQKDKIERLPPKFYPTAPSELSVPIPNVLNSKIDGGGDILKSVSDAASGITDGIKNITNGRLSGLSFDSFTSDEDLTYDGSDEIVRARIDAERASRGLTSLDGLQGGAE